MAAQAEATRVLTVARLLLDEMFSPRIAEGLTNRGHDVVAVAAIPSKVGAPDEQILRLATTEGRTLVTENVRDLEMLRTQWADEGRACAGLLYTSRQRFPRDKRWLGRLVTALHDRLTSGSIPVDGQVDWLT